MTFFLYNKIINNYHMLKRIKIKTIILLMTTLILVGGCGNKDNGEVNNGINDVTISEVDSGYKTLRFSFSMDDDEYDGLIVGLQLDENNKQANYKKMVNDIREQLSINKRFIVSDSLEFKDNYNLNIIPTDVEKKSSVVGDQSLLCWAASASNMLATTGWLKLATNPKTGEAFKGADDAFVYFADNFENKTNAQKVAIKWFFDGINMYKYESVAANTKKEISDATLKNYCGDIVYDVLDFPDVDKKYGETCLINSLDNNYAIGIMIDNYAIDYKEYKPGENTNSVHCITISGYIKNSKTNELAAVFIADSDNDASKIEDLTETETESGCMLADDVSCDQSLRVNKYTMFPIGNKKIDVYQDSNLETYYYLNGYKPEDDLTFLGSYMASEVVDYFKGHECETVIINMTFLSPSSDFVGFTDTGSKDVVNNHDLVLRDYLHFGNNPLTIQMLIDDYSYVNEFTEGSYFTYSIYAYNQSNDEEIEIKDKYCLSSDELKRTDSFGDYIIEKNIELKPGEYEITIEITGLYDSKGNKISEAYYNNNYIDPFYIVVSE